MRSEALIFILLVIITSGCISSNDGEVSEAQSQEIDYEGTPDFSQLVKAAEESEYSVEYSYDMGPAMYDGRPELHSKDGVRRAVRSGDMPFGDGGEVLYNAYYSEDVEVKCTEGLEETPGCGASALDAPPTVDYFARMDDLDVSHIGEDSNIGRDCIMYRVSGGDYVNHYIDICLDAEKGFATEVERKTVEENRTVESLEATDYSSNVEKDVEPLTNAVASISCFSDNAEIITTDFEGTVQVQANEFQTSIEMNEWSSRTLNLSGELDEQENQIEVHAGDSVETDICYKQ